MVAKACRSCRLISEKSLCPECKSTDMSDDFSGLVIIEDPENSEIAKIIGIKKKGRYAVRIR